MGRFLSATIGTTKNMKKKQKYVDCSIELISFDKSDCTYFLYHLNCDW